MIKNYLVKKAAGRTRLTQTAHGQMLAVQNRNEDTDAFEWKDVRDVNKRDMNGLVDIAQAQADILNAQWLQAKAEVQNLKDIRADVIIAEDSRT